jgi:hypothetical protein
MSLLRSATALARLTNFFIQMATELLAPAVGPRQDSGGVKYPDPFSSRNFRSIGDVAATSTMSRPLNPNERNAQVSKKP